MVENKNETAPEEPMEITQEEGDPPVAEEEEEDVSYNLKILPLTFGLHQKHGLRHSDYQRYRGYCSRRIARVRKATKMVQGEKKKFNKKEVTLDNLKEEKHLMIPLMTAERAWAYAMQLKFEMNTEPRKKYHMINRLRKAQKESGKLKELVMSAEQCNARAKLESQAYHAWISGLLSFELQDWKKAISDLTTARTIYEKLSTALSEDEAVIYKERMNEIVPSLRFCAYNSGDEVAKQDLLNLRAGGGNVDELLNQAREEQAATLQEVEWRKRKMAVKQEKVRVFLLRHQEFEEELENATKEGYEAQIEAFESLLMDCKDAIQVLRDELVEDPNFRQRQVSKEGPVSSSHFLYTYLNYIKGSKTIERNMAMIDNTRKALEKAESENAAVQDSSSKKTAKPQDLVRLYESIIQNLNELPQLAGLEEDLEFKQETEAKVGFFKAWRCLFIAEAFLAAKKWPEAMALYQRATLYGRKAEKDPLLEKKLKSQIKSLLAFIESHQFMAHANSFLESEDSGEKREESKAAKELSKLPLTERLDVYHEDPEGLLKGNPNLADFPPSFQPIACKPLFFDLAREQLTFPDLEDKLAASPGKGPAAGGASGGWLGGWLGGWGGKK